MSKAAKVRRTCQCIRINAVHAEAEVGKARQLVARFDNCSDACRSDAVEPKFQILQVPKYREDAMACAPSSWSLFMHKSRRVSVTEAGEVDSAHAKLASLLPVAKLRKASWGNAFRSLRAWYPAGSRSRREQSHSLRRRPQIDLLPNQGFSGL